jgi:hypothetical protein
MSGDFTPDQKRSLEGFASGLTAARAARGQPTTTGGTTGSGEPIGPDAIHIKAQDRVTAGGGKLVDQETFKRELSSLHLIQVDRRGHRDIGACAEHDRCDCHRPDRHRLDGSTASSAAAAAATASGKGQR